jgi:lipoprotein-releasing system permease protein
MAFEIFVARRYLRAKRKHRFISAVTVISMIGVATGVMALVVAMAINNGVQQELRNQLLGTTSHVYLLEKERAFGIEDWRSFVERFRNVEHVEAMAPALFSQVMFSGAINGRGGILKGIDPKAEQEVTDLLLTLKEGSVEGLEESGGLPGIIVGDRLAQEIGARMNSVIKVINVQGEMTPFGPVTGEKRFQVVGIFHTGFYEMDGSWAFVALEAAQQALSLGDVINAIEFRLDDLDRAAEMAVKLDELAGPELTAMSWMERNRPLFNALNIEKLVTAFIIGLIMLVAALNILIALVMLVMEKNKDVAILISMGARRAQIRKIFMWQGLFIGAAGTTLGFIVGHALCWVCDHYRLIPLEASVYGLSYVPFSPRLWDGFIVVIAAMAISYLITIYPANAASRVVPVEVLRYE